MADMYCFLTAHCRRVTSFGEFLCVNFGWFLKITLSAYIFYLLKMFAKIIPQLVFDQPLIFIRVARWFTFIPKIQIWVNFGRALDGKCWYILWPFGVPSLMPFLKFHGHLV
jgi:hypothetical protein